MLPLRSVLIPPHTMGMTDADNDAPDTEPDADEAPPMAGRRPTLPMSMPPRPTSRTRAMPMKHSAAHPGFQAVEAKIARNPKIRDPGAVLAASSRRASPAAKRRNPRLKRVGIGHAIGKKLSGGSY